MCINLNCLMCYLSMQCLLHSVKIKFSNLSARSFLFPPVELLEKVMSHRLLIGPDLRGLSALMLF